MLVQSDLGLVLLLRAFATSAYPHEGCGTVIGVRDGQEIQLLDVTFGHNRWTERAQDRYDLEPADILHAEREARARGAEVVGFWHSHPDHPAQPSQFDSDHAWDDYIYVICATTATGSGDLNAFTLRENEGLQPVELLVVEAVSL